MDTLWKTLKAILYVGIFVFAVYAVFVDRDRSLINWALAAIFLVYGRWVWNDYKMAKDLEERRFEILSSRLKNLEQRIRELEGRP
jgi:hypothetical protein